MKKTCTQGVHSKRCTPPVENYTAAYSPKATTKRGGWTPPVGSFVKLNVDAAFDADTLQAAVGAVLRDSSGKFLAGANNHIDR